MSRRTFWDEPRPANVFKCSECGERVPSPEDITPESQCKKCDLDLHSCRNCTYFDTSAEKECRQPITMRIPKKRANNSCEHFKPALSVDLTGPKASGTDAARKAFDDLFK